MKQNLRTGQYRNGESIVGLAPTSTEYITGGAGLAAWLRMESPNWSENEFGRLYTYGAVADTRGICPVGWHVPSDAEWNVLITALDPGADLSAPVEVGGTQTLSTSAGGALKSTATTSNTATPEGWTSPNTGASDASAFRALPAGLVMPQGPTGRGTSALWWTSTAADGSRAWYRSLSHLNASVYRRKDLRKFGLSVRCVKD
jgi:uncharacterized protein (TIGR02145 family)